MDRFALVLLNTWNRAMQIMPGSSHWQSSAAHSLQGQAQTFSRGWNHKKNSHEPSTHTQGHEPWAGLCCGGLTSLTQPRSSVAGLHFVASVPAGGKKAIAVFSHLYSPVVNRGYTRSQVKCRSSRKTAMSVGAKKWKNCKEHHPRVTQKITIQWKQTQKGKRGGMGLEHFCFTALPSFQGVERTKSPVVNIEWRLQRTWSQTPLTCA